MSHEDSLHEGMDTDPLNLFPGIQTQPAGPFGLPVPAPLADDNQTKPAETGAGDVSQPSPTTDDQSEDEPEPLSQLRQAAEAGENYIDRVQAAMDEETCELCKQILDNLRTRPLKTQVEGVKELAELKQAAERGADPAELAEVMEDFEVVDDPSQMM